MHDPDNTASPDVCLALHRLPVGVAATALAGQIQYANPHLCRVLRLSAEELKGLDLAQFRPDQLARLRVEIRSALLAGETWQGETALQTRSGNARPMLESCYPVRDDAGRVTGVVHFFQELSVLRRVGGLTRLALYDAVTGLPNRGLLEERLIVAVSAARRSRKAVAVLYADVDDFGRVNRMLDRDAGDELLRQIARRMQHAFRASDTVARMGSDEFAALLPDVDTADAALRVGEKMGRACSGWYEAASAQYSVTLSIGVSVFARHDDTPEAMLRRAEAAMYRVKAARHDGYYTQARFVGTRYPL